MDSDTYNDSIQKIDELNQRAWDKRVSDSVLTLELSREAVRLSEENEYKKGLAQGLRTLGFSYIRLAQNKDAETALKRAMALFEELNDLYGQSDVLEYYGIINRFTGDYETSLNHLWKSLELREQTQYEEGVSLAHYHLGVTYKYMGQYEQALDHLFQSLNLGRLIKNWVSESYSLNLIGLIYFETEEYQQALDCFEKSLAIRQQSGDQWGEAGCLDNIGTTCLKLRKLDEALTYCMQSLAISEKVNDQKGQGNALLHIANVFQQMNQKKKALSHARKSLNIRQSVADKKGEAEVLLFLASLHSVSQEQDLHFQLLQKAIQRAEEVGALDLLAKVHWQYYKSYKDCDLSKQALRHLEQYGELEKKLHKDTLNQKVLNLEILHRADNAKKEAEIYRLRNIELANLYEESCRQKVEIEQQKKLIEDAFNQLKAAQAQLIHTEKMASLGELTAGIAHEIQNPLNFVNNFSEVSIELIEELNEELSKNPLNLQIQKELINIIEQNLQKIVHHGHRADAIVKNMLQHSRTATGEKQPTDINALTDEYLRLSYHGLRAKDKSFNAVLDTSFDVKVGNVNVIPQGIGRVLLNLFNNAFYSVSMKSKKSKDSYEPTISVSTKRLNNKIEITVRDNGLGIPEKVLDKIYQPFFTTKPAGDGTGLGLSLSYDIVTKDHGGELKVETKEGEFAEFTIILP